MTIHRYTCPTCRHNFGTRQPIKPGEAISCVACYKPMVRATWAEADANDLEVYYTRDASGALITTAHGAAGRYV